MPWEVRGKIELDELQTLVSEITQQRESQPAKRQRQPKPPQGPPPAHVLQQANATSGQAEVAQQPAASAAAVQLPVTPGPVQQPLTPGPLNALHQKEVQKKIQAMVKQMKMKRGEDASGEDASGSRLSVGQQLPKRVVKHILKKEEVKQEQQLPVKEEDLPPKRKLPRPLVKQEVKQEAAKQEEAKQEVASSSSSKEETAAVHTCMWLEDLDEDDDEGDYEEVEVEDDSEA